MAEYQTWMEKAGFNIGMPMIEVLASTFHQDFYLDMRSADDVVKEFVDKCPDAADLMHLKDELNEVIALSDEKARLKYLHKRGLGYIPPDETVEDTFSKAVAQIDKRLDT